MREVGGHARRVDDIIETKLESACVSVDLRCHVIRGANNLGNLGMCLE